MVKISKSLFPCTSLIRILIIAQSFIILLDLAVFYSCTSFFSFEIEFDIHKKYSFR